MAGELSSLTELTTGNLADNDLLEVVDVSDTSMAGSGTNKKTLFSSIKDTLKAYFDGLYATAAQGTDSRDPTAHAGTHTNGADDIQSATNAQKGLATAAHIAAIEANTSKVTNATHTGDATGATALTLATVNGNVGNFGSATAAPAFTVNAKGLITAASTNTITPAVGSITGLGTGVATALAINVGTAGAPVLLDGAGGTPSAINLTNGTALPVSGITSSTSTALGVGSLELGNASDTTLARSSAGNVTVEGNLIYRAGGSFVGLPIEYSVALGDETTAATTGTKLTWRVPAAMTVSSVNFECITAPTGSVAILDLKESGTTIFSTKPQIAISATTSVGGAVPGVVSDTALAYNAVLTFSIDQIGSTVAGAGFKATIIGLRA